MTRTLWQRVLPAAVSVAILAFVFRGVDPAALAGELSWRVAFVMLPAFVVYAAVTLWLEATSVHRLLGSDAAHLTRFTVARIKCASYLLAILHYALGVAALTLLLHRRGSISVARAASVVLLVSSADVLVVLSLAGVATGWMQSDEAALQLTLLAVAATGFFGGLALLRAPADLGRLERIRELALFEGLRTLPLGRLAELFALRFAFSACFVAICGSAFVAFEVAAPFATLVAGVLIVAVVAALPIAVAGLGTSQAAFLYLFADYASRETLLAMSVALSIGMIVLRGVMGLVFAREFTREALRDAGSVTA